MVKVNYQQIKWEEIDSAKKAEFRMLYYSTIRLVRRLERKLVQMAEAYKSLENKDEDLNGGL
ncbi:MAG: hypothetical protein LBL47_04740 [Lactobacillus sp.]|jgi:hypothetical protein|nr:hypothetical protein [Lactobacillus sp.]